MKIIKLNTTMQLKEMKVDKISKTACPIITLNLSVDICVSILKSADKTFSDKLTFEVSATRFNVVLRGNHNLRELEIFTKAMNMNTNKSVPVQSLSRDVCSFADEMVKAHETLQMKKEVNKSI